MARKKNWENFVDYVVAGMKQREAYKKAYPNTKMKDENIDSTASAMINGTGQYKDSKVHKRFLELNAEAKRRADEETAADNEKPIADAREMQEKLTAIIRQAIEEEVVLIDPAHGVVKVKKTAAIKEIISAINMLAKMQGLLRDNINIDGNVGVVIVDDIENS